MRMIWTLVALLLALSAWSGPTQAQWNNDAEKCANEEVTYRQKIHYCTLAIASGQLSQPNMANTYFNRGVAFDSHGEFENAIADFTEAIGFKPDDPDFYINRGVVYLEVGENEKALSDFDSAIERRAGDPILLYNRGLIREQLGQSDGAKEDFVQAYALAPEDPEIKAKAEALGLAQ